MLMKFFWEMFQEIAVKNVSNYFVAKFYITIVQEF
jgi:hypothetical protein